MMLFDDTLGAELITLKTQMDMVIRSVRDMELVVENELRAFIDCNSNTTIGGNEYRSTGGERHDHVEKVTKQKYKGGLERKVETGTKEEYLTSREVTTTGDYKEKQPNYHLTREGTSSVSIKGDAHNYYIEGPTNLTIKGNVNLVVDGEWTANEPTAFTPTHQ